MSASHSVSDVLNDLAAQFSQLGTTEEKITAVLAQLNSLSPDIPAIGHLHAVDDNAPNVGNDFADAMEAGILRLIEEHGLTHDFQEMMMSEAQRQVSNYNASLDRSPCAYVDLESGFGCPNEGTMRCGGCKLNPYCSKASFASLYTLCSEVSEHSVQECQKKHWPTHRADCKNPIREADWKPKWVVEKRRPEFITSGGGMQSVYYDSTGSILQNMNLWGNIPAIDILNLHHNEQNIRSDLAIAFIASGDLRDVIRTINELPPDYPGELTVVLNDSNPMIVARNLIILLLLGMIENKHQAADIAVHVWYSAFLPNLYHTQIQLVFQNILSSFDHASGSLSCPLSSKSRLEGCVGRETFSTIAQCLISDAAYQVGDAQNELSRARLYNTSEDRLHRQYWPLEPSHRLAFHEFRTYGLLLPFGAANAHFNYPNRLLFSPTGQWLQPNKVNPLDSWHIPSVIKAGKKHGALPMDIYGCMYFYVSDQLRELANRISTLRITFKMFKLDACDLASDLRSGTLAQHGLPASIRFDRVDASNLMDPHYLGIAPVLGAWGPLLKQTRHATLLGHFMNWVSHHPRAVPGIQDLPRLITKCREGKLIPEAPPGSSREVREEYLQKATTCYKQAYNTLYDNSTAFKEYLNKQDISSVLTKSGLKLKHKHTVVPHRLGGSLKTPSALPSFPDTHNWYLNVKVSDHTWLERYMEVARV
ncbi:uncharacterized protein FIBRA_00302 [Fibroporia radiculosa]|uniref:DUF4470 domain-containing protein n=1 Tax=Fibroporia radiculosa TaxID=599839 RepID=J7SCP9_9APHY|nr:uncharacterized protein FIBRA_00302 [Fibroporia radiculosa]CCL98308.1 predicted protein [Fibroporia radiculosa]